MEYRPWGVSLRRGVHEPLVSLETFDKVQEKLAASRAGRLPPSLNRHYANLGTTTIGSAGQSVPGVFVLRGTVQCGACGRRLTGSLSRGKMGRRYPYYHCHDGGCPLYGKTVPQALLEEEFGEFLRGLNVTEEVLDAARLHVETLFTRIQEDGQRRRKEAEEELRQAEERIARLTEKIASSTSETVVRSLEGMVEALARQRARLQAGLAAEEAGKGGWSGRDEKTDRVDVGTLFDQVRPLLQSPSQTWQEGDVQVRRVLAHVAFKSAIPYTRGKGFGTPDLTLPYLITRMLEGEECIVVEKGGAASNSSVEETDWSAFLEELLRWSQLLREAGE